MAYTVLGLNSPDINTREITGSELKKAAIEFIRENCAELRFDAEKEKQEKETGVLQGASIGANLIPYNMQMDIDRLCLENALSRFLDSGEAVDAFDIYFCYINMFIGRYDRARKMIELLSEYETNGSSILLKHRDHFSHSSYVFALGLAIYARLENYRKEYARYCGLSNEKECAQHFLKQWGLTALFHDIGYPFEIPFEQVESYFDVNGEERRDMPYIRYASMEKLTTFPEKLKRKLAKLYEEEDVIFHNTDELFGYEIARTFGKEYVFTREDMIRFIAGKPVHPEDYTYYLDHAYFSANMLFHRLYIELECEPTKDDIRAMTAILLHNSLYKFGVAHYKDGELNKPLRLSVEPMAYLLMLCDELQCWDRTAYGRNSRSELHPMRCDFTYGESGIAAEYVYDELEKPKIDNYIKDYDEWMAKKPKEKEELYKEKLALWKKDEPKVKDCSNMVKCDKNGVNVFTADIAAIVSNRDIPLTVTIRWDARDVSRKKIYLSNSSFLNLYNFAVVLNGRWMMRKELNKARRKSREIEFLRTHEKEYREAFESLSLEYKLSNINQAKTFARHLNEIGCFYTDRPVDYPMVQKFTVRDMRKLGPLEHMRWLEEHRDMGWRYGVLMTEEEEKAAKLEFMAKGMTMEDAKKAVAKEKTKRRENLRVHPDMLRDDEMPGGVITQEAAKAHYLLLGKKEQDKDTEPMDTMLILIRMYDGLRIYSLNH